jgi:cold-inducible RNA-binding protein
MNSESRLFVGNLSYQTLENDLQEYFSQAGAVSSVNLMLDKFTGRSRGFAFVEFGSSEEANKAVEMFHNKEFQGRQLTVNIARPREERPERSGGGGAWRGDRRGGDRGDRGGERRNYA